MNLCYHTFDSSVLCSAAASLELAAIEFVCDGAMIERGLVEVGRKWLPGRHCSRDAAALSPKGSEPAADEGLWGRRDVQEQGQRWGIYVYLCLDSHHTTEQREDVRGNSCTRFRYRTHDPGTRFPLGKPRPQPRRPYAVLATGRLLPRHAAQALGFGEHAGAQRACSRRTSRRRSLWYRRDRKRDDFTWQARAAEPRTHPPQYEPRPCPPPNRYPQQPSTPPGGWHEPPARWPVSWVTG